MEKRNYSEITPQIKKLAAVCESDGFITSDLYEKYKVNGFVSEHLGDYPLKLEKKPEN